MSDVIPQDVQYRLEKTLTYKSKSLARDDAMSVVREQNGAVRQACEIWYATHLGYSGAQELQSKYNA